MRGVIIHLLVSISLLLLSCASQSHVYEEAPEDFVLVASGSFLMGSGSGEDNAKPVHKVRISKSFFMSKYEVTFEQYNRFSSITGKGMKVGDLPVPFDNG